MALKELLEIFKQFLKARIRAGKTQLRIRETIYDAHEVLESVENLEQWCYKELRTDDIEKVCRCKNCVHYKRFRKKGQPRSRAKMLCDIDKTQRNPEYYCGSARRKE